VYIQVGNGSSNPSGNQSGNQSGNRSGNNSGNQSGNHRAPLAASGALLSSTGTSQVTAIFEVQVTGGALPYTIQLVYGDGTYGIAAPGQDVEHQYDRTGVFHPSAIVTDGSGARITVALPEITVHATAAAGAPFVLTTASLVYGLVGAMLFLTLATALLVRSRTRRTRAATEQGEAIVEELLRPPQP
jgi:hypothetical protein